MNTAVLMVWINNFLLYEDNILYNEVDDSLITYNTFTTTMLDGLFQYFYDYGSSIINYNNPVRTFSGLKYTKNYPAAINRIILNINNVTINVRVNIE